MTGSTSVASNKTRAARRRLAPPVLIALIYLAAHLPFLAPSLEDFDSINFGLALHQYDPSHNQPHPPGYPVYVAAGRISLSIVHLVSSGLDAIRVDALALAVVSVLSAVVALVAAWRFFALLTGSRSDAPLYATALLAVSPLFWITSERPLSDVPGLAIALVSQVLLLQSVVASREGDGIARGGRWALVIGAFLMGLGIGVRSQVLWLTLPWYLLALGAHRRAGAAWLIGGPGSALIVGGLVWAIPLVVSVGGPARYLRVLGAQASGDFSFVDMLWSDPTPRHLVRALRQTFAFPWESSRLATIVTIAAAGGVVWLALRDRRALLLTVGGFLPYVAFHLLFQETETIRYALPVLVPVVYLAARAIDAMPRPAAAATVTGVAAVSLFIGVPPAVAYGSDAHPAFRAIRDMLAAQPQEQPANVFSHHAVGRALRVAAASPLPVVEPPERYEWLGPVDYWKSGGTSPVWFLADPRRTDLALIDPQVRRSVMSYRWRVGARHVVGGTRPIDADWYRLVNPGWFAGKGWSLTLEAGGVTQATGSGLDHGPIEAYVRRRSEPAWLLIGGRDLAAPASAPSRLSLTLDGQPLESWTVDPATSANFLRTIALPAGIPAGTGPYATLRVTASALAPGTPTPPVAIRQFDVQSAPTLMFGFGDGWHEEEFDARTGERWRWSSDRSILQIVPPQAVEVRLRGESPRKYFDAPLRIRLLAGDREIAVLHPDADFDWVVKVPADAAAHAEGALTIETDRVYLPATAGSSDTRRLGVRLFMVDVRSLLD